MMQTNRITAYIPGGMPLPLYAKHLNPSLSEKQASNALKSSPSSEIAGSIVALVKICHKSRKLTIPLEEQAAVIAESLLEISIKLNCSDGVKLTLGPFGPSLTVQTAVPQT